MRIERGAGHRVNGKRTRQARGAGWERVHVCVDDATRLAYVEVLPDEKARTAIGFLKRAVAFCGAHGITVERVMTDNGGAYVSTAHAVACRALKIRHIRTRPSGRAPTARQSASSAPCSVAGHTGRIYRDSTERTLHYPAGWSSITGVPRLGDLAGF